jgi:hypothetical protein
MKKIYLFLFFITGLAFISSAQEWIVYDADSLPDAEPFHMQESNVAGTNQHSNVIVPDVDNPGNYLLQLISPEGDPGKFMWKYNLPNDVNDPITLVARVKGVSDSLDRTMEFDFQNAGYRERLYIKNDNTYELKESGVKGSLPLSTLAWHIFRMVKTGNHLSVYLDENPQPLASVTTTTITEENYFRFGDGNGSSTLGGFVDWIIWDTTGTYAPGEGASLPDTLVMDIQKWDVYAADVLPDASEYGFTTSNTGGDQYTNTIVPDADHPGNNLLELISPQADPGKFMWKYSFPNDVDDPVTLIARVRGASDSLDRTMEFDIQNGGFRERLYIKNNNTFEMKESGVSGSMPGGPLQWHIYRITKHGDQMSFYLDENPVPVAYGTTATTSSENYFRFGDGNGSSTLGAYVDWMIWDTTGTFAPGKGMPIPDSLLKDVQQWTVYPANVLPDVSEFAMTPSNTGGDQYTNTIVEDADNPGNNLLEMISPQADPGKFMWKYSLPNDVNDPITFVARVKGASDTLDRTIEIDLQQAGYRSRLYIKNDFTYEFKDGGPSGDLGKGTLGWHIYRMTKDSTTVNFYLDENPVPVATSTTGVATIENYFRFGDGNGSSTLGADIDWIIWDTTGTYAPDQSPVIPDSLITTVSSSDAHLSSLTAGAGVLVPEFNPDSVEYELTVPYGTDEVRFIVETSSDEATVSGDTLLGSVPGTAVITVTAEDGYMMAYTIDVLEAPPSEDATLSSLTTSVGELSPAFSPSTTSYGLEVPFSTESVVLTATANDPNANVSGDGTITGLPTAATITVTAQAGNTQDYSVDITLAPDAIISNREELLQIYPNPASTQVNLEMNSDVSSIQIYSFTGNLIREFVVRNRIMKLDISSFSQGIYLIKVNTETDSAVYKLTVE